ncbi:hypothetical protein [Longimicrobium sp.]|uniref:hypothetical protein n=1 Tax=Longimicrobium sp. TaxID=2029185 RepID=UPI003B3ABB27
MTHPSSAVLVSVLAFSDLYDPNLTGNTVVAAVQAYLLTGSGGCWVYQQAVSNL